MKTGADERIRTADLLITNQLLYQLSYVGLGAPWDRRFLGWKEAILAVFPGGCHGTAP